MSSSTLKKNKESPMKLFVYWVTLVFLTSLSTLISSSAIRAAGPCDSVLVPAIEQNNISTIRVESYMNIHAEEEYERLSSMKSGKIGGNYLEQSTYKRFSTEFESSNNKSEFQEKVRRRLDDERYYQYVQNNDQSFRSHLTSDQINGWVACQKGGAILLHADDLSPEAFTLRVSFRPGTSMTKGRLELKVAGALFSRNKKDTLLIEMAGPSDRIEFVEPSTAARSVTVVGQMLGLADRLNVTIRPPSKKFVEAEKVCGETDECVGYTEVLGCQASFDLPEEIPGDAWLFNPVKGELGSRPIGIPRAINFGYWKNDECGVTGNGWHTAVGSCGKGRGSNMQRCARVRVKYRKLTFSEPFFYPTINRQPS